MAANALSPATITPSLFKLSAAFVDFTVALLLVAVELVEFPDPFVVDVAFVLAMEVVFVPVADLVFVLLAEVVLFVAEFPPAAVVFVAAVTLNEFPFITFSPALLTTFTALKFVLVLPNLASVDNALELPVVFSNN
jgi:hypothetical protein